LIQDLNTSKILQNREGSVVNVVKLYNSELSSIIDRHAPLASKNIILRPSTEWYSDELRAAKRNRRKAERRMRKSNLTVHREMFRDTCLKANTLLLLIAHQVICQTMQLLLIMFDFGYFV
jgi:hypothetical protein